MTVPLSTQFLARATHTASPIGADVCVGWRLRVPAFAFSRGSECCERRNATDDIDAMGNSFEVRRVAAGAVSTKMVQFEPVLDRTDPIFVCDAMDVETVSANAPVAFRGDRATPQPAGLRPAAAVQEKLDGPYWVVQVREPLADLGVSVALPCAPVGRAPTARPLWSCAVSNRANPSLVGSHARTVQPPAGMWSAELRGERHA